MQILSSDLSAEFKLLVLLFKILVRSPLKYTLWLFTLKEDEYKPTDGVKICDNEGNGKSIT